MVLGLLSALFFTATYVLNRAAAVDGGDWLWTAALRYLLTLPMLWAWMAWRGRGRPQLGAAPVVAALRARPGGWLLWSGIGFVLFYAGMSYAAASGPSWLVAGTFQVTVVAGMLCAPFLYRDARRHVPASAYAVGGLVLAGVGLIQLGHAGGALDAGAAVAFACVLVAAFAYPLGNRGLLLHLERDEVRLDATQRVFGLTLASQPAWLLLAAVALWRSGLPAPGQVALAAGVAVSAGIVATILFFRATGMVGGRPAALGAVEAMQAAEILFAVLLGALFLGEPWPRGLALAGAVVVVAGIVAFARVAAREAAAGAAAERVLRGDRGA
ncbi:multidrug resistance efflux transporter family protein [Coralloluteibacterium stylophorae]|uniref:Multidrug resistance efflux transporter family protein n=1 Tax=Coralloluteibacterium stylophorae TaxID=1776034 RepID=A0A8J7VU14_9GAMM|nr:multidrug resistance efflux transporter family protein [Coralloluteibacterium stylophorae]